MAESEMTIIEAVREITLTDPISTVLFLFGGLITGASIMVFGGLSFGSAVDLLMEQ
jgi:NADH:ubiquinone oxidoreductase subunit 6 (subunit J)